MIRLFKVLMSPGTAEAVAETLNSGYVGEGPKVREFEESLCWEWRLPGVPVAVNSGTAAIDLALDLCGVGPGDEVISTPMSCLATNAPILRRGAIPVWADVDPRTGLIDPGDCWKKVTKRTRAIVAVDWGGRRCDYSALKEIGPPVIQDAAHCAGPGILGGDHCCFSFQSIKTLTTGDGGALLPPPHQQDLARRLRWFGLDRTKGGFRCEQDVERIGFKLQMNDIAASIGLANLPLAKEAVEKNRANAAFYHQKLNGHPGIPPHDPTCCYWLFTVLPRDRAAFEAGMKKRGIECSQVHSRNDRLSAFKAFRRDDLPGLDEFAARQTNVPVGWWMSGGERERVGTALEELL